MTLVAYIYLVSQRDGLAVLADPAKVVPEEEAVDEGDAADAVLGPGQDEDRGVGRVSCLNSVPCNH